MTSRLVLLILCLASVVWQSHALTQDQLDDYAALSTGIGTIATSGYYMSRHILYDGAFAVATASSDKPFISATRFGEGRVIHFGHEGILSGGCCSTSTDLGNMIVNSVVWAGQAKPSLRVAYTSSFGQGIVNKLVARDNSTFINGGLVSWSTLGSSGASAVVDVLILNGQDTAVGTNAAFVRTFIQNGGGVVLGSQSWNWAATKDVTTHPSNVLLAPLGIIVSAEIVSKNYTFTTAPPPQLGNADVGLGCLRDDLLGNTASPCYTSVDADITNLMKSLTTSAAYLPQSGSFYASLTQYAADAPSTTSGINPSKAIVVKSVDGLGTFARNILYKYLPVAQLPASADAPFFPGVPPAGTPPLGPVTKQVKGTVTTNYWQCLGLYAMPGTAVTVTLPADVIASGQVRLQVGLWTDTLYHKTSWVRVPEAVRSFVVNSTETTVGSALGGLIYIRIPSPSSFGNFDAVTTGAIAAPVLTEGMTAEEWAAVLASSPAPWGEVSTSKLAITSPNYALAQTAADPALVVDYWNKVMDSHAWMAGIPTDRPNPMRIQHDVDISVGWMHSGYPIMMYMSPANSTLDPVNGGNHWGHFHELGHNHQNGSWTWGCTSEVTVNFFSARAEYVVRNNTNPANFYGWSSSLTSRYSKRSTYFTGGVSYSKLCSDAGLFLDCFLQIAEDGGFGFELLRDTIATYKTLSVAPANDDAELQTWVIQQSKAAGYDVSPYYLKWGWPVSTTTQSTVAALGLPSICTRNATLC